MYIIIISKQLHNLSAQGVDEHMINVHYYYFKTVTQAYEPEPCSSTLKSATLCQPETCTHVCEPEPWTCP